VPQAVDPKCVMPGDLNGGGRSYAWLDVWPGQQDRSIRQLVKSGSWEWQEWFTPGANGRFAFGHGHHDVHGGIKHTNQNDSDVLILEIPVPQFLEKNHADGRVWIALSFISQDLSLNGTRYFVNDLEVNLNDKDESDYSDLFYDNKAQLFGIEDERPQVLKNGGLNLVAVPAGQIATIKIDGFVNLRHIWAY